MFPMAVFPLGLYLLLTLFSGASLLFFFWHLFPKWKLATNSKKRFRFPPGPTPWPFIGNCAQLDLCNPHRSFLRWKKQFGPIYTVYLPTRQIVLAGAKEQNELLTNLKYADIFADRPTFSFIYGIFSNHQPDGNGIILSRQQVWQRNRRFASNAFRDLGMGKPQMEVRVQFHKDALIQRLAKAKGGIVDDLQPQLAFCYGNIIQDLVMGHHYEDFNDPEFLFFKHFIENTTKEIASFQMLLVDCWPLFRFFSPAYWRYIREGFQLQRFLFRRIEAHIEQMKARGLEHQEEPNCFIDAYLRAAHAQGQSLDDPALRLDLVICAGDLWAGGLETVVATTTWAALFLLHHPDKQKRAQEELDAHFHERPFCRSDQKDLHYFRALIDEVQRIANVLPWNVPHSTSQEVTFNGWTLPKDTIVHVQLGAVHMDPEHFPEPDQFRPERFLDADGKYKPSELLKPFGMGRRSCLGTSLVHMELPIVLASLLQNFKIEPIPGEEMPSLHRNPGMVSTPDPFKCAFRLRHGQPILS